ncbi:hypothetical protein [Chelativorans salis]|uniref:Uncharacterized protein n=1 Tax=Chelativorans salis TaxID=2978478 RepID=A0ABT2LJU9_9HYPH|nr:hypothetical protein [Chelativorans sp. EGI FJ00035]MCT7374876.1 hypothetical protein [Chelativorans sp. EGI FJ00035]
MTDTHDVNLVTTMHRGGYEKYGQTMVQTFLEYWPENVRLTVYAENFELQEQSKRLEVVDLHQACPALVAFKEANKEPWQNGLPESSAAKEARTKLTYKYNFKYDAVKFSNKVFAYCTQASRTSSRYLVWLDADTVTTKPIPEDLISSLGDAFLLYLGRRYTHSECGFLRFDMGHPNALEFFRTMQAMYVSGEIYTLNEWHDSFVFDVVRSVLCAVGTIDAETISSYEVSRHPFVHSALGTYMDHLKGDHAKQLGRSSLRSRGMEPLPRKILRKLGLVGDV